MSAPSRATAAGRAYHDLRNKAHADRRPVDALFQLYVLEGFLARLAESGRRSVYERAHRRLHGRYTDQE